MRAAADDSTLTAVLKRDRLVVIAALVTVIVLAWAYILARGGMGMSALETTAMTGHQDTSALILAAAVGLNVAATTAGTMLLGMPGAALGTTTALTAMTIWTWVEVRRRLGINASIFALPPSFGR